MWLQTYDERVVWYSSLVDMLHNEIVPSVNFKQHILSNVSAFVLIASVNSLARRVTQDLTRASSQLAELRCTQAGL
jgi:hypothetical protein